MFVMQNNFDLNYSDEGLLTRVIFLASQNDLNIFVEDVNKEYEYEEIFERLLSPNIRINCIFPTGGKPALETAYDLFGSSTEYGKTFFIADGDFDKALGKTMIQADNFIYLNRYNIESYLLHKESILHFMRPKLRKTIINTEQIIQYDDWFTAVAPFFKKLFSLHLVVQRFCPEVENVKRGYARFLESTGLPKDSEYEKYKAEISSKVSDIDSKIIRQIRDAVKGRRKKLQFRYKKSCPQQRRAGFLFFRSVPKSVPVRPGWFAGGLPPGFPESSTALPEIFSEIQSRYRRYPQDDRIHHRRGLPGR